MSNQFSQEVLRACVGHVCQAIGYQGIYATPLGVLTDLLHRYLAELCRLTHRYTEHFGRTEPTLDDLGLAFMDMGISVSELEEYINNVDCPPFPHPIPQLPVPRPSNLNFLKPGSREILSRPIHIHEHLPPMYPEKEEEEVDVKVGGGMDDVVGEGASPSVSPQPAVKRPADSDVSPAKKPKFSLDDEGQPVREIVSVMMTTSGFISSAREGKLPEARCPDIPLALPRCSSPSTVGKKKMTVEKLIRQKNNLGGGGGPRAGPVRPPRPKIKTGGKDRMNGKGLKLPKFQPRPLALPKGGPPGSSPLPPKLKMPLLKPPTPKPPKVSSPKGPILPKTASTPKVSPAKPGQSPGSSTPKSSTPKIKVPKPPRPPKNEGKKSGTGQPKGEKGDKDKDKDKDKEKEKDKDKDKEGEAGNTTKKVKKEKDSSKKEGKKEGSKKEGKKEGKKDVRKDKEGRKEGSKKETKKEKEMKKERERERELIIALQSSSAVTVTSIPAPSKPPDGQPPPGPEKAEGKSKLSIFKKINKSKDAKEEREAPAASGPASAQPSRDSSPDLMIDETPGRGQRRPLEETPSEAPAPVHVEVTPDVITPRSPGDYTPYHEDLSPPTTPSTPRTPELPPHLPPHRSIEKRRARDKGRERRPRKDRSKSPKGGPFSPGPRDAGEPEPPERPKTPEGGLPMEDMGGAPGAPFLPAFPTAPGFIPPFSRFPFLPPFGGLPPRPGLAPPIPDLRLPPHHHFLPRPPLQRPLEEDSLCPVEDNEPLERPPTPRHPREGSPLMMRGHGSPMRSPSPSTPPRPRTPAAHHSPPPQPLPRPHLRPDKPEKTDKEKKKEHKKEKKEKEKEKEKGKKKKDKKDKEKEKDKSDKKKEKEKTKQEKKEKKVKREKEEGGPRITMKLTSSLPSPSSSGPDTPIPTTPKLVIKPVVKHDEIPPLPPPPQPPPPSTQDDQPGSPEIAKFSALITRAPRSSQQKRAESPPALPVLKIKDVPNPMAKHKEGKESSHTPAKVKEVPPLKIKNPTTTSNKASSSKVSPPAPKQAVAKLPTSPKAATATTPKPPPVPKVMEEKKSPGAKKPREKKEKKEKKVKDIPPPSPNPLVGSISKPGPASSVSVGGGPSEPTYPAHSPMPIVSPPLESPKPSKKQEQKSTGLLTETVGPIGHFVDDQGNEVWICPTCGKQDDGSPMIGCDTCDDWYHWVCVGIQVPPNDDVNWYCNRCLSQHKQRGAPPEKKKRGRKKN